MRFFRNLPIGRKLTLITMLISGVALLLACTAFAVFEQAAFRRGMARDFAIMADMFDDNVAPGLTFSDSAAMELTLRTLGADGRILAAGVYDKSGTLVAHYQRADLKGVFAFPAAQRAGQNFTPDRLDTFKDIPLAGETIGTVYIGADLAELHARVWRYTFMVGMLWVVCSVVALLLVSRLQKIVSQPIIDLAKTAAAVAAGRDYTVRAVKHGDDEVGRLIDGFNDMLAQIQARDAGLRDAHDQLEKRVDERTRELQQENTERRNAEAALRESQLLYHSLVEQVPAGIFRKDRAGRFVFVNSWFCRLQGVTVAQFLGKTASEHAATLEARPNIDSTRIQQSAEGSKHHELIMQTGRQMELEECYRDTDGQTRYLHVVKSAIHDMDGQIVGSQGILFDITQRKQAEVALKGAQEEAARQQMRFKFIFEAVPVGISWLVPEDDNTHLVNPAHERITGVSAAESQTPGAFAKVTHPDDYRRQQELVQKFVRGEIEQFSVEKRYLHPGGRVLWAVLTSRMFTEPATGKKQAVTTLVDITALKEAQEQAAREQSRFKFIFESLPVGIAWMVTGKLQTRIVNPAHAQLSGVPMARRHQLKLYRQATHPEDQHLQDGLHDRLVAGEIDHYAIEKRYVHADGRICWVAMTLRFFRDQASRETQEITTIVDITGRKQAELEREKLHRQLLDVSRQAGMAEVATGVLHNVGNVLNSVNVSTTLLCDRVRQSKIGGVAKLSELLHAHEGDLASFFARDSRGRQVPAFVASLSQHLAGERTDLLDEVESLRKNVEHIKEIVAMQQSYAKISGVTEVVAVSELVEDALRMNAGSLTRHAVTLVRDYQAQPVITVEKHKVLQILVNLIRNAKYACDDSGRSDKRMTIRIAAAADSVQIAVIDNGVGIAAANLTRIFAHGFTTRKTGHGFGLHNGALAAKELGGSLTVQSAGPGQGAVFILELPQQLNSHAA